MDKTNLKKIALMGMAGGMLFASQAPVAANASEALYDGQMTLAHGCGGAGAHCGGAKSAQRDNPNRGYGTSRNYTAYDSSDRDSSSTMQHGSQRDTRTTTPSFQRETTTTTRRTDAQDSSRQVTESEFLSQLNSDGRSLYQTLSPEGKAMALKLAPNYSDKNQAVKVASQKIAEKRNKPSSSPMTSSTRSSESSY
jgi:hypothetical protein